MKHFYMEQYHDLYANNWKCVYIIRLPLSFWLKWYVIVFYLLKNGDLQPAHKRPIGFQESDISVHWVSDYKTLGNSEDHNFIAIWMPFLAFISGNLPKCCTESQFINVCLIWLPIDQKGNILMAKMSSGWHFGL